MLKVKDADMVTAFYFKGKKMFVRLVKKQTAILCLSVFTCLNVQAASTTENRTVLITKDRKSVV